MENDTMIELTHDELMQELELNAAIQSIKDTKNAKLSAHIKKTWDDVEIFRKRTLRNHVTVEFNGKVTEFKSVAVAFKFYNLPMHKHSRFRTALKLVGKKTYVYQQKIYKFEVVK